MSVYNTTHISVNVDASRAAELHKLHSMLLFDIILTW